ncbi:MAG TPA: hypothetical protein VNO30_13965 [Kofleriaceae bacterium]|nr:hypothetical protein [Kofleriaceae bacterium]
MTGTFDIKLLVVPSRLSMSERTRFQAGVEATNHGAATIDPQLSTATLTIDGHRSQAWDHAVQKSPTDPPWRRLSPAQRVSIWWPIGNALFDGPGRYQLVLKLGDHESIAEVEVTP